MSFKFVKGKTKIISLPRTASVTFTSGDLVILTSGLVATATAGDNGAAVVGVAAESVASTDSDFATAAVGIQVEVPAEPNCVLEGDVANGSLLTTSIGVEFGLTSAGAVDFADTSNTDLTCVGFISASKGRFVIQNGALYNA
jgi:hypothetical protein